VCASTFNPVFDGPELEKIWLLDWLSDPAAFLGIKRRLITEFGVDPSCKDNMFRALEAAPTARGDGPLVM
jgi:hypothetical protein